MAENGTTQTPNKAIITAGPRGIQLRDIDGMLRWAQWVDESNAAPKYLMYGINSNSPELQKRERLARICIVTQAGLELGLSPVTSLGAFYMPGGKLTPFVATARGAVLASGLCEALTTEMDGDPNTDEYAAVTRSRRRGWPNECGPTRFSIADAKRAGLWGKRGAESGKPSGWITFSDRMLRARSCGQHCSDYYADVLGGFADTGAVWDAQDIAPEAAYESTTPPRSERKQAENVTVTDKQPEAQGPSLAERYKNLRECFLAAMKDRPYTAEQLDECFSQWAGMICGGDVQQYRTVAGWTSQIIGALADSLKRQGIPREILDYYQRPANEEPGTVAGEIVPLPEELFR